MFAQTKVLLKVLRVKDLDQAGFWQERLFLMVYIYIYMCAHTHLCESGGFVGADVRLAHRSQLLVGAPAVGQSTSEPGELSPACRRTRNIGQHMMSGGIQALTSAMPSAAIPSGSERVYPSFQTWNNLTDALKEMYCPFRRN